jgi:hypothetical protein
MLVLSVGTAARADLWTEQTATSVGSTIASGGTDAGAGGSSSAIIQVNGSGQNGVAYENNLSTNSVGSVATGQTVNILAADYIAGYAKNGVPSSAAVNFGGSGAVMIFAGQATITSFTNGTSVQTSVQFINGGLGIYPIPALSPSNPPGQGFNKQDLTTWGFDGTQGKQFYTLGPKAAFLTPVTGFGDPLAFNQLPIPAGTSTTGQNTANIDTTFGNNPQGVLNLLFKTAQDKFLVNNGVVDPGFTKVGDALQLSATQNLTDISAGIPGTGPNGDLALANQIFNTLDPGLSAAQNPAGGFATNTGAATDFITPTSTGFAADIMTTINLNAYPGLQETPNTPPGSHIPEPTTVALVGLGLAGLGLVRKLRRRVK